MKYDDFSLPQNWESLAKAYSQTLKKQGFIFVKLDPNHSKKELIIKEYYKLLFKALNVYKKINKIQKFKNNTQINKMYYLTQNLTEQMQKSYPSLNATKTQTSQRTSLNLFNVLPTLISLEAQIIKNTLNLMQEEENQEMIVVLKTSLFSRLEILENLN